MSLAQNIIADVTSWGEDAVKVAASAASAAVPGLGAAEAALQAIANVTKMLTAFDADNNTPEMKNASSEQKLENFCARINNDLASGNTNDLEALQADPPL
jgi:hypothetical protein